MQDRIRQSVKDQFAVNLRVSKVSALLNRTSMMRNTSRKSVIEATTNKKDFDYLFLMKPANDKMYKPVKKVLESYKEGNATAIFSEYIQSFQPDLKATEYILVITWKSLFLIDKKFKAKQHCELQKLRQIIMIKTNPCIFALSFGGQSIPLLLQSFRRSELIMYLLTQCKENVPKVSISRTKGIRIFTTDKVTKTQSSKVITFEKVQIKVNNALSKEMTERIEKNVQLNNFANAISSGYLKMRTDKFFGGYQWEERFVVLTNIGLLYFADPLKPPIDLFPVLDCEIVKVPSAEVKGNEQTFKLVYLTKSVTF